MSPGPTAPAPLSKSTRTSGRLCGEVVPAAVAMWRVGEPDRRQWRLRRDARGAAGELVERRRRASACGWVGTSSAT